MFIKIHIQAFSQGVCPGHKKSCFVRKIFYFFGDQCEMWKTESLFWVFGICVVRFHRVKRVGFLGIMLLF